MLKKATLSNTELLTESAIINCLEESIGWFLNSGVMRPNDGSWGIAERIVTTDNQAIDKVLSAFPFYTKRDGAYILEHRRPDCNFETAWLFAIASKALKRPELANVTSNILDYLFNRSGMLNKSYEKLPAGCWEWSSNNLANQFYFDDNGWNGLISFMLANYSEDYENRFELRERGLKLTETMNRCLVQQFFDKDGTAAMVGKPELPHWGSMACMAIAVAAKISGNEELRDTVIRYHKYIAENQRTFNNSEQAYIMIGGSIAARALDDSFLTKVVENSAEIMLDKISIETGNIASEHYEMPNGEKLIDLIYTMNWAFMGFQLTTALTGKDEYSCIFEKMKKLLIDIQDKSTNPSFNGSWRGMYDFDAQSWGGGDLHEGGSGSIYTGWTNAPVSIAIAHSLCGDSMLDYLVE